MLTQQVDRCDGGEAVTSQLDSAIVETRYQGHCSAALVGAVLNRVPAVLDDVPGACWLVDLSGVTGFDSAAREPGSKIFRTFRERGGRKFAAVVPGSSLRMLVTAVAFATGLPVKVFAQRSEAISYLRAEA
jgi:hypothetical protein